MKRLALALLFAVAVITVSFAGCLYPDEEESYPGTFTDQLGNTISISEAPERIITLAPSLTEIVFTLGLEEKLVGIDDASTFPKATADITKVSSWQGLDLELVVAQEPDIVFADKALDMSGERYEALTGAGLVVVQFFPKDLDEMLEQITLIGEICDVPDTADSVVSDLKDRVGTVSESVADIPSDQRPKVLYVTYYDGSDSPWVGTDSTMSGDLIAKAGGNNIVSDSTGYHVQVSLETIVDQDPDVIFTSQSSVWPTLSREVIMADDVLKDVSAVKNDRVFDIDGDLVDRPGPRMVDGLEEMYGKIEAE
jgi:iron complex transport system substrate-binding protein